MKKSLLTTPVLASLLLLASCGNENTNDNTAANAENNANVVENNTSENENPDEENDAPDNNENEENNDNNEKQLNDNNEENSDPENNEQQSNSNNEDSEEENNEQQSNNEENADPENNGEELNNNNENNADQENEEQAENNNANEENESEEADAAADAAALEEMTVHFIDVGQADATLFSYSYDDEDYHILYDTGNWNQSHALDYLNGLGIDELDLVIVSHPHADHIGGVDQMLEAGITMDEIWMSGDETTSQTFERVIDAVDHHDVDYVEPRTGEEFQIGPLELLVVNPDSLNGDVHDGSVSVRFDYGDVSFLFTGDAEDSAEQRMLQTGLDLDADIFQLGHHGSRTSTTAPFLEAVDPSTSIYSAGAGNSYGHPHQEVVDRVEGAGGDLYGTDVHGTVLVHTDGDGYSVDTDTEGTISEGSSNNEEADDEPTSQNNDASEETETNDAPEENEAGEEEQDTSSNEATEGCVNINSASMEDLQRIHQIGEARAEQMLELRPFSSIQDMTRISGIGDARIAEIEEEGVACVQ